MNPSEASYAQPEKDAVRQRVIAHAVNSLTKERESSPVVTAEEFDRTMDYALRFFEKDCRTSLHDQVKHPVEDWHSLHTSRVGTKTAEDLTVLFLAGPDPVPDLMAFRKAGVPFTNIWAIEGDQDTFKKAVGILGREGLPLKIHNGTPAVLLHCSPAVRYRLFRRLRPTLRREAQHDQRPARTLR